MKWLIPLEQHCNSELRGFDIPKFKDTRWGRWTPPTAILTSCPLRLLLLLMLAERLRSQPPQKRCSGRPTSPPGGSSLTNRGGNTLQRAHSVRPWHCCWPGAC